MYRVPLAIVVALAGCSVDYVDFARPDATLVDAPADSPPPLELVLSTNTVDLAEGAQDSFQVGLNTAPMSPLTVTLTSSSTDKVLPTPQTLTFDATNWSTATVTVSGREDADVGDEAETITLAGPGLADAVIAVTVDDNDGLRIIASPESSFEVTESGTTSLGIRLSAQPTGATVVMVASSDLAAATLTPATLTFTPDDWDQPQFVSVNGIDDEDTTNANATVQVSSVGLAAVDVPLLVVDDDVLAIVPTTTNLGALSEGGAASFGVTLTQMPPGDVVVTVASSDPESLAIAPESIVFTSSNWHVPQDISVSAPDDLDVADADVTITLGATGLQTRNVAASVNDDDTQVIVAFPLPFTIDEGTSRELSVRLAYEPAAPVTLAVSSLDTALATVAPATLTFTPADYDTYQIVNVTALDDIDAAGEQTALRIESAAEGLLSEVPVAVTDDDQLTIETSQTSVTVDEAGMMQFGVRLTATPVTTTVVNVSSGDPTAIAVSPASLTFTTSTWNAYQMVTVSGVQDADLDAELVTLTLTAAGLSVKTVDATVNDDDMQAVLLGSPTVSVNEGGTATVDVTLRYPPVASINVTVASDDTSIATAAPATLTFTPANFDTPQQITISGVSDADAVDDTATITASASGAASDSVDVTVNDDDALGITTSETTLSVGEGDAGTFTVRLTAQPSADTTVTLASSNTGTATVSPASLTFTVADWNTPQTATVTTIDDANAANESITVTASSTGLATRMVTVTVVDDETLDFVTTTASLALSEGGMTTLGVQLSAQPVSDVVVSVAAADPTAATATPTMLTFTPANYATNQMITVAGADDVDLAAESTSITLAAPGVPSRVIGVDVSDDDAQVVTASTSSVTVAENDATSVGFALGYQPAANVDVTLAVADPAAATTSVATLTFTPANYATPQQVQIFGADDADATGNMTTLTATAAGATAASVAINVTDDDTLGIEVSTTAMGVGEESGGTFGVRLTAAPAAAVTVTVASADTAVATVAPATLTFDAGNWNTYQQVTVTGTADADAASETTTVTVASTGLTTRTISMTIADDDVQDITTDVTTLTLAEDGTATFGVRLAAQPLANRTVTIMSSDLAAATVTPASLTFTPANYGTYQIVTLTGVADTDLADEEVTIGLTSAGLPERSVAVGVTDDDTQVVQLSMAQLALTEGGSGTIGVRLGFIPTADVTVTLTSVATAVADVQPATLTFTPANYATYQNVTITAPHDADLAAGSTTIDIAAPGASGATAEITVTDDDAQAVQLDPGTLTIAEGASGTVGVRLAYAPSSDVTVTLSTGSAAIAWASPTTLTFTPANYATAQNVTVHGTDDANVVTNSTTLTAMSVGATSDTTTIDVTDDDVQIVTATQSWVTVAEGGTATFGVALGFEPAADVIVTVSSASAAVATVSPVTLTFTAANYNIPQTVTLSGTQDANLVADTTTVTVSAPSATSSVVDVTATDDDTQSVVVSTPTVTVTEGSTSTFGVRLGFIPSGSVTVSLASADLGVATVSPATLTFTAANYNVSQSVTVSGIQDGDLAAEATTITASAPNATSGRVTANVTDDDMQAVVVSPSTVSITEGVSGSFGVTLAFEPSANVTVTLASSDSTIASPSPTTLTFTPANYNVSQSVSVTAHHDANLIAGTASIAATAPMATAASAAISISDDDTQVVQFSTATVSVTEGNTAALGVRLGFTPTANVTVSLASNNSAVATVSPSSLVFTPQNYATLQTVTVSGTQDLNTTTDTATISGTAAGATSASATANVSDDDVQRAVVTPSALALTEGGNATFGVTLAFAPASNVTVDVSSLDTAVATASPATLTFTPANYNTSQAVTVTSVHDLDLAPGSTTISVGGVGVEAGTAVVDVTDDDMQAIQVSPGSLAMTEGGNAGFGVTLAYRPTTDVTVSLASANSSVAGVSPSTLTFTPANYNVSQTVNVAAPEDLDLASNMTTLNATLSGAAGAAVTVTVSDNDVQVVQVNPATLYVTEGQTGTVGIRLGFIPTSDVTVSVSSDNTAVAAITDGETLTFTPANYNVPQNVTVSAPHDANLVGNLATVSATATGATGGGTVVDVTDDDEQRVIMASAVSVPENEARPVGIRLAFEPTGDTTVTVTSSDPAMLGVSPATLTFTAANYNVDQSVSLAAADDDDLAPESVTVSATAPDAEEATLVATITDDDEQAVVVSSTTLAVAEGGTGAYTVRLAHEPAANVTVTVASANTAVATATPATLSFTPANYAAPQTVTVTGTQDDDLAANTTTITASAADAAAGVVTVTNNDDDTQAVVLGSNVSMTEGTNTTLSARLAFAPASNVTVTLASSNTVVATVSPSTLTFTPTNWNATQSVTITAPQDDDLVAGTATITGSTPGATSDTATVSVTDDDTQRVVFTPTTMSVTEGLSGTLGVRLQYIPTSDVTVAIASANTAVARTSVASLTFTPANYASAQNVTITAQQDDNLVTDSTTVTGTAAGVTGASLALMSPDNDSQAIEVLTAVNAVGEADTETVYIKLAYQPTANVTVSATSSNTAALTVSPSSRTFTPANYDTYQSIAISGVNDTTTVHETVTITFSTPGVTSRTLSLRQYDNDLLVVSPSTQTICVTDTGQITISVARAPLDDMTVAVKRSGTTVSLSKSSVLFGPSNTTPKTVNLTPQAGGTTTISVEHATQTTRTVTATVALSGC